MANPYSSNNTGMATSMSSLPGAAPPEGYPGGEAPPGYVQTAPTPEKPNGAAGGNEPYVVTSPGVQPVAGQEGGAGLFAGQTMGINNSTLAMGAAALGVGGVAANAYGNGQRLPGRKPMKERPHSEKMAIYCSACCMVIMFAVGGALLGVGGKQIAVAKSMDPDTDFDTGECTISSTGFNSQNKDRSYDCNCGTSYNSGGSYLFSSSYSSYSSSYSYRSCDTCYEKTCEMTWDFKFRDPGSTNGKEYGGERQEKTVDGQCSQGYSSMGMFKQGQSTTCWIAKDAAALPKDEGAGDATGYTCPNPECAKIITSPQIEYESQLKTGKILNLVGNILVPIGGVCAAILFICFCCCGRVNKFLEA